MFTFFPLHPSYYFFLIITPNLLFSVWEEEIRRLKNEFLLLFFLFYFCWGVVYWIDLYSTTLPTVSDQTWYLVRGSYQSNTCHPANDRLNGTAFYGKYSNPSTYSSATTKTDFSIAFASYNYSQLLIAYVNHLFHFSFYELHFSFK